MMWNLSGYVMLLLNKLELLWLFQGKDVSKPESIKDAHVLLNLGDSVTTDHISPAGSIARNSPAARYLGNRG